MNERTVAVGQAHILVVDDEPEIAESLADFLRRKGYNVSTAVTGDAALHFLETAAQKQNKEVDLVLLDMRMPDTSGLQVLNKLRGHRDTDLSYTRVIMLTAASGNREMIESLNAGADDYITKPYHPQELLARVNTLLRTQQLEKQLQRQSNQLAHLNRVSNQISSTLELRQVFSTSTQGIIDVLNVDMAAVFMKSPSRNGLQCQHISGDRLAAENYPLVPIGQGVLGQTIEQPHFFRVNNPATEPDFYPPTDIPPSLEHVTSLMTVPIIVRGNPWGILAAYNKKDGGEFSDFDLDLLASLSSSISGAVENAFLVQNLRARQQDLLDSRNVLQAIMDGILHPIYTINDSWQLVSINQSKVDELNKDGAILEGEVCYKAFFNRSSPCEHCHAGLVLAEKEPQEWSIRWKGSDQLPREWSINAYPVPGTKTQSASAVVVWQDRTEERRLEQSLLQAGKLAAIGQLAAGVAHEINNPLTAINANAEMLKMFIPKEDENFESVDLIHRAGIRAAKVVGGLLDFARKQQYTFIPVDVNLSIEQALDLVSYQLHTASTAVVKNMTEDLPRIPASSEHIKSVWINLIINARDAMRDAGVENPQIEITTRTTPEHDVVQVIFRDNGPGIPEAAAAHIFEPFYTTKDPGKGTGLGLATCHRIIEQHGGEIEMISTLGQGATFIVRLPTRMIARTKNDIILLENE